MREAQHYCRDGQMNRPHRFKNRDITRCLKAASAAGVSPVRLWKFICYRVEQPNTLSEVRWCSR